jgi:transposase
MLSLVEEEPTWTTTELSEELLEGFGIEVSRHTVGRALREAGFSRKRGSPGRQLSGRSGS